MPITYPDPQPDAATKERTEEWFNVVDRTPNEEKDILSLIKAGICLEARDDNNGRTPLHGAAILGNLNIVNALLAKGADVDARDDFQQTPLHLAALHNHLETAEALLLQGADIEAIDEEEETPLLTAAEYSRIRMMKLLLSHGADIEARKSGFPAMYPGIMQGNPTVIDTLLAHGENVHVTFRENLLINYLKNNELVATSQRLYANFIETRKPPESAAEVCQLLSVWPLVNPDAHVDRAAHLRQMFRHAKWESPEQAAAIVAQLRERGESAGLCASLQAIVQSVSPQVKAAQGRDR